MEISVFRGAAGEVVRGFVRPRTLLTLLPVLLATGFLGFLAAAVADLANLPPAAALPVVLAAAAPVVGRFALPARDGDLAAGFFSSPIDWGEVLGFSTRYLVLTVLWAVPVLFLLGPLSGAVAPAAVGGLPGLVAAGPGGLLVLLLGLACLFAPTLSFLIATRTESVGAAVSMNALAWLVARRADLVAFYAALIGGAILFAALAWPLLMLVALVLGAASPEVGLALVPFAVAVPGAAVPILLGRLCGAFVAGEQGFRDPEDAVREAVFGSGDLDPSMLAALAVPPASRGPAAAVEESTPSRAARELRAEAARDPEAALARADELLRAFPANANVAAEVARVYRGAGRHQDACRTAAGALGRALAGGLNALATDLFAVFAADRDALGLDAADLEPLGWALLQRRALDDAAWCFETMAEAPPPGGSAAVEKGLVAVADAAAAAGDAPGAVARYRAFLERYPQASLAGYVRNAVVRLERGARGAA